jgi:hypothetical protein
MLIGTWSRHNFDYTGRIKTNLVSLGCLVACRLVAGLLVACHLVVWSFGREVIWSRGLMVVGCKIIWSRVLGRGSLSRMSFGRRVIWSRGHLDARSFGREVTMYVSDLNGVVVSNADC